MNNKYKDHFKMTNNDTIEFVKTKLNFFSKDADIISEEIGDGNINYVFKLTDKVTGKTLVLKQADKLLRASGRPLDLNRSKIEADILKIEDEYAPGFVPKIYYFDEIMSTIVMEDISEYKNLRTELMKEKIFKNFSAEITTFLVNSLLPTTDLVMDRAKKKEWVKKFINIELCDISEDLVFTEPYTNYKKRNIITEDNFDFVNKYIYNDKELLLKVAKMRNSFLNNAQALLHGDLHSGSIFINKKGIKVIDPEFAFYGPMGYDVGNVLGNLFFSLVNKKNTSSTNIDFISWLSQTIIDIFDMFKEKFSNRYDEIVTEELYKNKEFKEWYERSVISDSLVCAGLEIIRRVVGDTKVLELTSIKENDIKISVERELIKIAIHLIKNSESIKTGKELIKN